MELNLRSTTANRLVAVLTVMTLILAFTGTVFAQRLDGTLRGEVKDPQGAVVPEAKVTATNQETNVSNTALTTSAGTFVFPTLLVGKYTVAVEKSGFKKYVRKDVGVEANRVVDLLAGLEIGSESTTVEVTAGAETIQTSSADLNNTVDTKILNSIPFSNNQSTIYDLAQLSPNVTSQGGGVNGQGGSIGGTRPRFNNFNVDGTDDNRVDVTGYQTTVINDAVAEFNLTTNQFSAEYGHSAGGQFNIVTKSGTNQWHGTASERAANRHFDAFDNQEYAAQGCIDNPTTCDKARFDYNIASGTAGGPIVKDKVFIFGGYQRQWAGLTGSGATFQSPTAAGLTTLQGLAHDSAVTEILNTFPTAGSQSGTVMVNGNAIPIGNVNVLGPSFLNEWDWLANGDINLRRHAIRARFLYNRQRQPDLPAPPIPQFIGSLEYDVRKAILADSWTISDRWINEIRLGWTRQINGYAVPNQFTNFPNVFIHDLDSFTVGPETNAPQTGGQNVYQFLDQQTYTRGKHTFKWGVEGRRYIGKAGFLPRARGEWQYATLEQFINDYVPSDFAKKGAGSGAFDGNQSAFYWFVQDDVKVSSHLTLNLGVRYEWNGIANGEHLQLLNAIATLPGSPMVFGLPQTEKHNFMPRLGFAWDPKGDGKWAVRGGFGLAYDVYPQNFPELSLPPQLQSEQDPDITCANAAAPSWCAGYNSATYGAGGNTGQGFLSGGGLLQVNIPPANQIQARNATQGVMPNHILPRVYTWSLGVQHELFKNSSLELRYLGTHGTHLLVQRQLNAISAFDNGATPLPEYFNPSNIPTDFTGAATLADFNSFIFRPYAAQGFLGSVTSFAPLASSNYNSVSADFIHHFSHGLYFRTNYTFSRTIDNATQELFSSLVESRRAQDTNHIDQDKGNSALDNRHHFSLSWNYTVPTPHFSGLSKVLGGWEYAGDWIIQSGMPLTVINFSDANGNKDSAGDRASFNPAGDPFVGSDVNTVCWNGTAVSTGCADATQIVGYVAAVPNAGYVKTGTGAVSNLGRNTLSSPGRNNWNMSLFKNTHITERFNVRFGAEVLNVFNHPQFSYSNPGAVALTAVDLSAISATGFVDPTASNFRDPHQLNGGGRQMILTLKVIF